MRRHQDLSWEGIRAPQEKAIGNFTGQACDEAFAYDRKGIVPQVGVGVVDVATRILADVGKEELTIGNRSNPCGELSLAGVCRAGRPEHKRILVLNNFRLKRDRVLFVALKILQPKQQEAVHGPFEGHVPRHAVRSEIAALLSAMDKRKVRLRRLRGEVDVFDRRPHRDAGRIVRRDRLFGIAVERINIERNGIVEDANAAANHRFPHIGSPLESQRVEQRGWYR